MIPVIVSTPLWPVFNSLCQTALGRPATAGVDRRNMLLSSNLECVVLALAEFREAESKVTLKDAGSLLQHCSVTFFSNMTDQAALELLIHSRVKVIDCDDEQMCYLLTGTLEEWKQAVLNLAVISQTRQMRQLAYRIITAFDDLGLSAMFDEFRRTSGTELVLVKK